MNAEQLICQAGAALAEFARHNDTPCFLDIVNSTVVCRPIRKIPGDHPFALTLSRFTQKEGVSSTGWDSIGTALLRLYNKELTCQAHQKP